MAKKNKNKIVPLLIILGISIIASVLWTQNVFKSIHISKPDVPINLNSDEEINYLFSLKEAVLANIGNFLEVGFREGNIWDELYQTEQFKELVNLEIEIDIEDNIGNPTPFMSTVEEDVIVE